MKPKKIFFFLSISLILIILDRLTKMLLDKGCFFILCLEKITNKGGVFGIFQGSNILFIFIALVIIFFSIYFYIKSSNIFLDTALIFIFSGTFGNLIDRVFLGHVIDIFYFNFWPFYPNFNMSDIETFFGIIILLINIKNLIKFKP